ncbi:SpaA isopeptide-forming pilin-related protein [Lacrimispora sp.]|uniref:SpaA isopeptide-forming pilin-related protein n=1 Tax=Lacrimispora sp. TaxID=2719234 RepID=UPI0032E4BAFD
MKKGIQRFDIKRKTAGLMAIILAVMTFLTYFPENMISFADYAQTIEPSAWASWNPSIYSADNTREYTPTGLMYETKDFHLGAAVVEGNFPAGAKQYLVKSNQSSESDYDEFDKSFIYCVAGHTVSSKIGLGSQAFLQKYWSIKNNNMPEEFPAGDNSKIPELKKFNFLMNVYASYMGRNDSIAACNDTNTGTAKYIVAATINWIAANKCEFTGDWKTDLELFRESADYKSVLKQMNPNTVGDSSVYNQLTNTQIPDNFKARGCNNNAEWMFSNVWGAATITKQFDVDAEETVYYAKMDHSSDTYMITIPYSNDAVKDYYQHLAAKDLYGDWTFNGPADAGLVFTSQTGEVPDDEKGIATLYWPNPGQVGTELAKDLGSAQLATFKFYTQDSTDLNGSTYAFDKSQTYFAAKMDKDLEVHVRVGSARKAEVQRYKHTEGFGASYNVGLNTFDSETGKPLANTHWDILEKFNDSQLENTDLDLRRAGDYSSNLGSLTDASWEEDQGSDDARISLNYSGDTGLNDSEANRYNQGNSSGSQFETWDDPEKDPCNADEHITDSDGVLHYVDSRGNIHSKTAHSDSRNYIYLKGYCSGHPAPVIEYEEVPELEVDEETGDSNEDEIEAVEEANQELHDSAWANWLEGVKECEDLVEEGGFFHAIDPTGQTQKKALEEDQDEFYKEFISLKYQYSAKELLPAPGYSLHGNHPDDIPLEWRTVTSSEYKDYQSSGLDHEGSSSDSDFESDSLTASTFSLKPLQSQEIQFVSLGSLDHLDGTDQKFILSESETHYKDAEVSNHEELSEPETEVTATVTEEPEETHSEVIIEIEIVTEAEKEAETEAEAQTDTREETTDPIEAESPEELEEVTEISVEASETIAGPTEEVVTKVEIETETTAPTLETIKKKIATDSHAKAVYGEVTLTGLLKKVVTGMKFAASKVVSLFSPAASSDEDSGSNSSLYSLPESTDTDRLSPLSSSIKDWTFTVYDHRTEGDVHFNKKDMDLKSGENGSYDAYGDAQGDGTLEGAVYGLFAAADIPHPDGHSGVVFQKDDLISIATTDRNGDASFLSITQAPGYTFNYQTGTIEKTSNSWADNAPRNLYIGMAAAIGKESDAERFIGHTSHGSSISLTDSRNETASGYEKLSSNQGRDGTGESSHSYPIENNESLNGNCWIGRPLIVNADGTQYYIKELTRSEGYELSVYGKDASVSNREAFQNGGSPSAEGTVSANILDINREKKANTFTVNSSGATNGYQIYANNIPEGASFYRTESKVVEDPNGTHTEYVYTSENAITEEEGARVVINGSYVEANVGDTISLPNGEIAVVTKVSDPEYDYTAVRPSNALRYTIPTFENKKNTEDLMEEANEALKKASFKEPDEGVPWMLVPVEGDTFEEQAKSLYEGMEEAGLSVFNCLRIEEITDGDAVIRYSYRVGSTIASSLYDEALKLVYIKMDIQYEINGTTVSGYLYVPYKLDQLEDYTENANGFITYAKVKSRTLSQTKSDYPDDLTTLTVNENPAHTYWVYAKGEPIRNSDGSIKTILIEKEVQVSPGYDLKDIDTPVDAVYDGKGYSIKVQGSEGTETTDYKITYSYDLISGTYTTPQEYALYYGNISVSPNLSGTGTYIEAVTLRYDKNQLYADGGTRNNSISAVERPIVQKVKIAKDIEVNTDGTYDNNTYAATGHKDHFTESGGGTRTNAAYIKNFRFKTYLKTNLERLYRAEDGTVIWQDRNGNTVDINAYRDKFPEKVQKLYTRVDYQTSPLSKDSNNAAIVNTELYSYANNLINADQNPGYTAVLESGKGGYRYDKFFDAIKVANEDQWDRTENNSSSFKLFAFIKKLLFGITGGEKVYPALHNNPDIENRINTLDTAKDNALRSDHVRQFAITWYLETEVAKLVKENQAEETESATGNESYPDQIYDQALASAIKKAENYLKPFFTYDFDEIYSIAWDSEADGGKDKDNTTLSVDLEDDGAGYCYGISEYLPYGTYVTVEQQPFNKDLGDLFNKHYKTDAPKEIELPAVYEGGKSGSDQTPEILSRYYNYKLSDTASQLSAKYHIRFNEEWLGEAEDLRKYVIRGHNYLGNYEIYPYGLDLKKLSGSASGDPSGKAHFTITQGETDPVKDYYNTLVDPAETGGNESSHYLTDNGNYGKRTANGAIYETDGIEKIYHYGSVSENKESNESGTTMKGMQTAYDGKYASMLVPWSVTEPADETTDTAPNGDGSSSYQGYGYRKFKNTFYTSRLRIEKLDSETGENILHDGALFALYAASREEGENTDGKVKFYETDTRIGGSKEFLEAMGASNIIPPGQSYSGLVPAGSPVCEEREQVILSDEQGRRTGQFEAFTTTRDGLQARKGDLTSTSYQDQNTGYLVTPQTLGAGTYVLCEIKPPAGYVRSKPVAIEIYSDQTTYYLDGDRDSRVAAAIYEDKNQAGTKGEDTARIYIGNTPVRLEVSKIKDSNHTVTYKTDTRLEGTELELKQKYGTENLEFAYKNGTYLGYAWYKGTIETLQSRKDAGEDVNLVYVDGVFAGYGLIERTLDTDDDQNRFVSGAKMTLYDAITISESGDSGDYGYNGVEVARDRNNNVQSIKVLKGYAGTTVEFLRKEDLAGSLAGETGNGTWTYETIDRNDTDILYYSLGNLTATETGTNGKLYGYDRNGNKILVKNRESIFILKAGQPTFELTGGDLLAAKYSSIDKIFTLSSGTLMYHLDSDGNRDAYVNPTTGMAYTKEGNKILVWPVKISRTQGGAVIAREKIKTFRIASIHADTDQEYITGTYNGSSLAKNVNPVLNGHGLPEYYQKSGQTYKKGDPVYDIDGDYVRYRYDDLLNAYNDASYNIDNQKGMEDIGEEENTTDDKKLYHRQGESRIMENTWISGEKYPNDPFQSEGTVGQADMLKRVIPGTYIMEEVSAPSGYVKGIPEGITVTETKDVQKTGMEDEKIKVEIAKTDAADKQILNVISDYQSGLTVIEPKGAYSYNQVSRVHLVLYKAKRIYTTDSNNYPKGYYLVKAETTPAKWTVERTSDNEPVTVSADWITDSNPKYFEGIPAGDYILEEMEAADGYVRSSMELTIKATGEVQTVNLKNDHTKLEIYKYYTDSKGDKVSLPNNHAAGLALYEAKTDSNGTILMENGKPVYDQTKRVDQWITNDLTEYTEETEISSNVMERLKALLGLSDNQSSFVTDFEAAYKEKGQELTFFTWYTKGGERTATLTGIIQAGKGEGIVETWTTDTGKTIRITIYRNVKNGSLDTDGQLPLIFEYQFNYKENGGIKSYDTLEGMHRIDYLPFNAETGDKKNGNYVLVEETVPDGFEAADPKAIVLTETGDVQRFSLENEEKYINVLKVVTDGTAEYAVTGAVLALYRADADGNLLEDADHLIETWTSGSDGTYTEEDRFNGDIPAGLSVGDLIPHRIDKTAYGAYYIVETEAPAYMQKADPEKIIIGPEKIPFYKVVNIPATGKLEIKKKASDTEKGLEHARFEVTNNETGKTWYMVTEPDGVADLTGLPVGEVQTNGIIKAYTYTLEEISPPDFYQISGGIKKFQFDGKGNGNEILYTCEIENDPTIIYFKKTNFDTGMAVEGAELAVYKAVAVNGEYEKDGESIATAVSGPNGFTLTKKLSAGQVYIMEELKAPAGYVLSAPLILTVNKSGTGILNVSNDFSVLKLASENGTIEALTITGRVPVKTYLTLKDLDTGTELPAFMGTGSSLILTANNGISDGHLYQITEYTRYSDGQTEKSEKETRRIYLDEQGTYSLPSRTYLETRQELTDSEGNVLADWIVSDDTHDYTITNPVMKESPIAKVTSSVGADHSAVKTGSIMKYTIFYTNPYNYPADIKVKAVLSQGLDYLRSTSYGVELNGAVTWNFSDVAPHESGNVDVVVVVSGETGTEAKANFITTVGAVTKTTSLWNPIVPDGSVSIINKLTGTGKSQTDPFTYHVKFTDQAGVDLIGYQAFTGSETGRIKGEGDITLTGDEFITFSGLPFGTRYEITKVGADGYEPGEKIVTGEIRKNFQSNVFESNRNDDSIREILTAGGSYKLMETTSYSDGNSLLSGAYRFEVNPSGMVDNVDMEDRTVQLYFSKIDRDTGKELSGGCYQMIDAETNEMIYEFTKEGERVQIPAKLVIPGKEYIFKEISSPDGYAYEKDIRFIAEESGISETIVMEDQKTDVNILKTDAESGALLSGGRFTIREKDTGTLIKEFTPTGEPVVFTGLLIAGRTYELSEEEPPAGYSCSESVIFTVPEEAETITVTIKDQKTEVEIQKLARSQIKSTPSEAARPLSGSTLQILNEDKTAAKAIRDGNGITAGEDLIFTTGSQFEVIKGQLTAGKNYWLHELRPTDGYAYAKDVAFTMSLNGPRNTVVMIDEPTHVILSKKTITGSEELPGNHLSVIDYEGSQIDEWMSGEQPHEIIGKLIAGETYRFIEKKPADGYACAEDITFTVSKTGGVDQVEIKNNKTKIRIRKVNSSGQILKGATLQILDQQKNIIIPDFISTEDPIDITGKLLAERTYYLHEVSAPDGYLLASDVSFTVPKGAKTLEVTMLDIEKPLTGPHKMNIRKFDAKTGNGIENVEFSIYQSNGKLQLLVKTDKNGYADFAIPENGTYSYKETKTAPGYLATDHTYTFTIQNGEISENSTLSVVNYLSPEVIIKKADAETMKRLAGAELEIRNEAGESVFNGITDGNGIMPYHPTCSGKYTVHEVKAPAGYHKTDSYLTFYVTEDGVVTGDFIMFNNLEKGKKKGIITAKYQSDLKGFGITSQKGKGFWNWLSSMPKTGDAGMRGGGFFYICFVGVGFGIFIISKRYNKKDKRRK